MKSGQHSHFPKRLNPWGTNPEGRTSGVLMKEEKNVKFTGHIQSKCTASRTEYWEMGRRNNATIQRILDWQITFSESLYWICHNIFSFGLFGQDAGEILAPASPALESQVLNTGPPRTVPQQIVLTEASG